MCVREGRNIDAHIQRQEKLIDMYTVALRALGEELQNENPIRISTLDQLDQMSRCLGTCMEQKSLLLDVKSGA